MKLLVVSHACSTPANQAFFGELIRLTGWSIDLVTPSGWLNEYGRRLEDCTLTGFTGTRHVRRVWFNGNIPLHLYRTGFLDLFARVRPDAVFVQHEPFAAATAQVYLANLLSDRVPFGFSSCQNIFKRFPPPFRWSQRAILRKSSFAFPITQNVADVLIRHKLRCEPTVLPLPIDDTVHFPRPEASAALREEIGAGSDVFVVGYAGRLVEQKGLSTLLHAFRLLADHLPCRLLMVGDGPCAAELDRLSERLGVQEWVVRRPFVSHPKMPAYLSAMDVLALPSETRSNWKEQFGRVITEALACGVAVVGSDSGEIPFLIRETGGGLVFPEGDAHALAERLKTLARDRDLRKRLADAGREKVRRDYTLCSVVNQFASTIERAVKPCARRQRSTPRPFSPISSSE